MDGVEAAGATRALSLSSPLVPSLPQYLSGGGPWGGENKNVPQILQDSYVPLRYTCPLCSSYSA